LDDSPLHAAVLIGDTVKVLEFDVVVDVPDGSQPSLPATFTLSQNYPNPFNATTEINFSLARAGDVRLTIYNLLGQEVKTLVNGRISAGEHRVTWDGSDNNGSICATGLYLYRLETSESIANRKMLLLK
jgi:flagellar hook assembly protein FlgD